jgi:hypothetical protein
LGVGYDVETVINPKVVELGKPVCSAEPIPPFDASTPGAARG